MQSVWAIKSSEKMLVPQLYSIELREVEEEKVESQLGQIYAVDLEEADCF